MHELKWWNMFLVRVYKCNILDDLTIVANDANDIRYSTPVPPCCYATDGGGDERTECVINDATRVFFRSK